VRYRGADGLAAEFEAENIGVDLQRVIRRQIGFAIEIRGRIRDREFLSLDARTLVRAAKIWSWT